jgi:hypothetical protein
MRRLEVVDRGNGWDVGENENCSASISSLTFIKTPKKTNETLIETGQVLW